MNLKSRLQFLIFVLVMILSSLLKAATSHSPMECPPLFDSSTTHPQHAKRASGQSIYDNVMLPIFHSKIKDSQLKLDVKPNSLIIRAIPLDNGVVLPEYKLVMSKSYSSVQAYEVQKQNGQRFIEVQLPMIEGTIESSFKGDLLNVFYDHSLHPYISSEVLTEGSFVPKDAQLEGSLAFEAALQRGDKQFGYIAPTGVGKTYVMYEGIKHMHEHLQPGLIVVAADEVEVVKQLLGDLKKTPGLANIYSEQGSVIHWGADSSLSFSDIMEQVEKRKKEGKFTLLYSTVRSLNLQALPGAIAGRGDGIGKEQQELNFNSLASVLASFVYDEAHHAGASQISKLLENLQHKKEELQRDPYFLFGTTATPFHFETNIVSDLFEGKVFMALIDTADSYLEKEPIDLINNPIEEDDGKESPFITQLLMAMSKSYIRQISNLNLLLQGSNGVPQDLLVQKNGSYPGSKYTLNKEHMPWLLDALYPKLKEHEFGYFAVPSIDDAKDLQSEIEKRYPQIKTRTFHSDSPDKVQSDTLEAFRNGEFNYLITVKKLDEAIDLPFMSLYIDLNRSIGPRQVLQRLGRVLRLFEGKGNVDVVALFDLSANSISYELINSLNNLMKRGLYAQLNKGGLDKKPNADELGVQFNSSNLESAATILSEAMANNLLNATSVPFYDPTADRFIIKKRSMGSVTSDDEAWEIIRDWLAETGKLPLGPNAKSRTEAITEDEQLIWNLMQQLGGVRVVKAELIGANEPTPVDVLDDSPLGRFKRNTSKSARLEMFVDYLEFQEVVYDLPIQVEMPQKENKLPAHLQSRENLQMLQLGDALYKWLKTIRNNEIADFLKSKGVLEKYLQVFYVFDKKSSYLKWVQVYDTIPNTRSGPFHRTLFRRLGFKMATWLNAQPEKIKTEISREANDLLKNK